ncbi:MAG: hypothetical protein ACRERE_43505, partial [Candidatus Entotheonellia bacterium]
SLDAVFRAPAEGPTTRVVRVGERDVEVDDVVAAARPEGVERWRRAAWDRGVDPPAREVWAAAAPTTRGPRPCGVAFYS